MNSKFLRQKFTFLTASRNMQFCNKSSCFNDKKSVLIVNLNVVTWHQTRIYVRRTKNSRLQGSFRIYVSVNVYEHVCPDQKQHLKVSLSRNKIIERVQELAGNLTTHLIEKTKKSPLTVTMVMIWTRTKQACKSDLVSCTCSGWTPGWMDG